MVADHHHHEHDSHCGGGQAHDDHRGTGQADQVQTACVRISQRSLLALGLAPLPPITLRRWQEQPPLRLVCRDSRIIEVVHRDLPAEARPVRIMTQVADAAAGLIAALSKAASPPGKVSQRQWQRAE